MPGKRRTNRYRIKYGITVEQYDKQLAIQGGGCAICGRPPKSRRLAVDHCHSTKKVRGLLCHMCNRALAFLRNDPDAARAAEEYLWSPPWQV